MEKMMMEMMKRLEALEKRVAELEAKMKSCWKESMI